MRNKTKKKTIVLSLAMMACLLSIPLRAQEQSRGEGGLLGTEVHAKESFGLFGKGGGSLFEDLGLQNFGEDENDLTLQTFGEEAPIGNGMLFLIVAGIGYATRKKQTSKTTQNGKENKQ